MSTIKLFFWFWFPAPQIGEEYVHADEINDPWLDEKTPYTIIDRRGNYYRVKFGCLTPETKHRKVIVAFYRKVGFKKPNWEEGLPF